MKSILSQLLLFDLSLALALALAQHETAVIVGRHSLTKTCIRSVLALIIIMKRRQTRALDTGCSDLSKMVAKTYGSRLLKLSEIESALMVAISRDSRAGKALCDLLDPYAGAELDVQSITRHVPREHLVGGTAVDLSFKELSDAVRKDQLTLIGYITHEGKGYIGNIDSGVALPCDHRDMVVVIGDIRE